jgi:hypothetical protein
MTARKIFSFVTNLLGLNFSCNYAPKTIWCVAIYQTFVIAFGFYMTIYEKLIFVFFKTTKFNIYTIIDVIQVELFFVLQLLFTIRTFKKRKLTKEIFDDMNLNVAFKSKSKGEKIFFLNLAIIIIVRALKIVGTGSKDGMIYMTKVMFTELIFASSDFLFKFHISCLTANLNKIKVKLKSAKSRKQFNEVNVDILKNFLTKKKIEKRFSVELFITILYNYIQMIFSFYWIFMRVKFKRLGNNIIIACLIFSDLITFLYPIQPILCLWCAFSTYEEYLNEVKHWL